MKQFDKDIVELTLNKIKSGTSFLYIGRSSTDNKWTIGATTTKEFEKKQKEEPVEYREVRATEGKIKVLLANNAFLVNESHNIMWRAQQYLNYLTN